MTAEEFDGYAELTWEALGGGLALLILVLIAVAIVIVIVACPWDGPDL